MADVVNATPGAAPQPVSNTAGQPAQAPAAPSIDPNEFATYKRHSEQYRGVEPLVSKVREYGMADPRVLDAWGPAFKELSARNVNPQHLLRAFTGGGAEDAGSAKEAVALTEEELGRRLSEVEQKAVRRFHEDHNKREIDAEYAQLNEDRMKKELAGLPDEFLALAKHALPGLYMQARQPYGDDHPLKGQFGPAGRDGLAGIFTNVKDTWAKLEAKAKASALGAIGNAARSQTNSTVAGTTAPAGQPNPTDTTRPGGKPAVEAIEAAHARIKQRRGEPV